MSEQQKPKTLGDIAEVLRGWRSDGITPQSVEYAIGQVWWDRDDTTVTDKQTDAAGKHVTAAEGIALIRRAIQVLDEHTTHPEFAGPWTAISGDLYGVDPENGRSDYPVAIGGDEIGSGLSHQHATFIARTAGNPRFLRALRLILADAEQTLDRDTSTVSANADALTLASSILEPGTLGQHTTTGA